MTADRQASSAQSWAIARLALGLPIEDVQPTEWSRLFEGAVHERCAPLAWMRSRSAIEYHASQEIAERWHAHVLCAAESATGQVEELRQLLTTLSEAGVWAGVLKGLPLSVMLYGDVAARRSMDFDLFVDIQHRAATHAVLCANGWRHVYGDAPEEGTYLALTPRYCRALEVHSAVADEPLLAHVELPAPAWTSVDLGALRVMAHGGATLPVFLAAHLAKHPAVPLLWWIDLAAALASLLPEEWDEVRATAADSGLAGCLSWALSGVEIIQRLGTTDAAAGIVEMSALRALHSQRSVVRLASLAEGPVDAAHVVANWAWPPSLRAHPVRYLADAVRRVRDFAGVGGRSLPIGERVSGAP